MMLGYRLALIVNGTSGKFYALLTFQFIVTTLYWIFYLFHNRLKDRFMAVLVGLTVLYYATYMVTMEFLAISEGENIKWESNTWFASTISVATNLLLLTPSISYAFLVYLPLCLLTFFYTAFRHSMHKQQLIGIVFSSTCCMIFWYIY